MNTAWDWSAMPSADKPGRVYIRDVYDLESEPRDDVP